MERTIFLLFLCAAVEGVVGKHVFVNLWRNWPDAQAYCRANHTDLSSISSRREQDRFPLTTGLNGHSAWIGLERDPNNIFLWKWSGGGRITFQNWKTGQPDNYGGNEPNGQILPNGNWNDDKANIYRPFYCLDMNVEEEMKTWEEALEHCRDQGADFISLPSETDHLLAQNQIQKDSITDLVWIGLRFLEDGWLWVNNDPLEYEAWSQGDLDHLCPMRRRCGALTKKGLWENRDCMTKLNFICA